MKTIYFDKKLNLFIDDISNKKSLKDIKNEFGIADYQIITVDDSKEHVVVIDNILQKKTFAESRLEQENKPSSIIENKIQTEIRNIAVQSLIKKGELPDTVK